MKKHMRTVAWNALLVCGLAFPHIATGAQNAELAAPPQIMVSARSAGGESKTLLPDGSWLLIGGQDDAVGLRLRGPGSRKLTQLPAHLAQPRSEHTATLLPDGTVWIFGGSAPDASILDTAELFDPATGMVSTLNAPGLLARSGHSATVLTDGRILIAGGVDRHGEALFDTELYNPTTRQVEHFNAKLDTARLAHLAQLLPDDGVLLWGGLDKARAGLSNGEQFDQATQRFNLVSRQQAEQLLAHDTALPSVVAVRPAGDAAAVPVDQIISVRFAKRMDASSLNTSTVTLLGPGGVALSVKPVPAENGMLLFVTPGQQLLPSSRYTLFIQGAKDQSGRALPFFASGFDTAQLGAAGSPHSTAQADGAGRALQAAAAPGHAVSAAAATAATAAAVAPAKATDDSEEWYPDASHFHGDWRTRRGPPAQRPAAQQQAVAGATALSGQVLKLNGKPLAHVTVRIGSQTSTTDAGGRFVVSGLAAGAQTMAIDGGEQYGYYEVLVPIKRGETTALSYPIWLSRLDAAGTVAIASPTQRETVLTSPRIPGLELHIPAGTVIRDHNGKIVTELNMTAIPTDRPPFPIPNTGVPVYFTIQPGGAVIQSISGGKQQGARLIYPNFSGAAPGSRIDFWNYSAHDKGWYVYGQGAVSPNGKQVVPDPGVAIYEFSGAMISVPSNAPLDGPPCGGCRAGDPVDLFTGLFLNEGVDLAVSDTIPIEVRRSYRPRDRSSRAFGVGTNLAYDMFLVGDTNPWTYQDLILPDGGRIHFVRTSAGTGYGDAVYSSAASPGAYNGAMLQHGPSDCYWQLTMRSGARICFPESYLSNNARKAAAISMSDTNGNLVKFDRDEYGNLERVTSPNGRGLSFNYDSSNRITRARDDLGRTVLYEYDTAGRLFRVTDPAGKAESYTYDTLDQMLTVQDRRGKVMVTNKYDTNGRVFQQTYADSKTNLFAYVLDGLGKVQQTTVTNGRGFSTRYVFNASGFPLSITTALGKPEQQSTTYVRNANNQVLSETDALGRKTTYTYDSMGNPLTVTRMAGTPAAATVTMTYKPTLSSLATVTDALGHISKFDYDANGNLTSVIDANGYQRLLDYDTGGRLVRSKDALGHAASYTYDGADLVRVTNPLDRSVGSVTDALGRPVAMVDPVGRQSTFTYDELDRLTQVADPTGSVTTMAYDPNGNLTQVKDAKANQHTVVFDDRNAPQSNSDPLARKEIYTYDANHNVTTSTNRKGELTRYDYDALDRISLITYADGSTVKYTYDAGNRITQVLDSVNGTVTQAFDGHDRLTLETTSKGSVTYTYYANGLRKSMTVSGQPALTYTYDAGDRLVRIDQAAGASNNNIAQWIGFMYDNANRRTQTRLINGVTMTYTYDDADQLVGILYKKADASIIGELTYSYDAAGRHTLAGGSLAAARQADPVSTTTVNAASELAQWNGQTPTYDAQGNMTSDGVLRYVWNARGQLIETRTLAGALLDQFSYDALGRRQSKTVNGMGSGYVYDGANIVQELNGTTVNNSSLANVRANYLSGGTDEMFAQQSGSGASAQSASYLLDGLGSTVRLTNADGDKIVNYAYDAYGDTVADAVVANPFQYTGRENDQNGLYYYRARYYSPRLRRFIQSDPIGLAGGINTHAYVEGNPVSKVDPSGEFAIIGGVIGGLGDLGYQLYKNGGNLQCVNWWEVGSWALTGSGAGLIGRAGIAGVGKFFWNTSRFSTVSRAYWGARGGAGGMSLDHWAISQAAGRSGAVSEGVVNAGWNLLEMPGTWNTWLGFAPRWGGTQAAMANAARVGIQVGVPGVGAASGYAGYQIGKRAQQEQCGCR